MRINNLKWAFPIAFVAICVAFLAFKPAPAKLAETTLYFKYQPTSDFTSTSVTSNSNWELVSPSETCEHEENDVACSFSITVSEADEASYLTGSNPSSRVQIQANGTGPNYHVDDVLDITSPSNNLQPDIANIERP
ncbi:hypothetical protein [Niabella hibiscisoli]|uniref:hypothetical protein n=1 Tax=Niabella hibiscisoli TaxID=1825928 RepID=UPI001F0F9807|nr:hypothetical protein [Niabella hibiscisoli]MCH5719934.1 hypothetical protein [Niabella hibiscisoli]